MHRHRPGHRSRGRQGIYGDDVSDDPAMADLRAAAAEAGASMSGDGQERRSSIDGTDDCIDKDEDENGD